MANFFVWLLGRDTYHDCEAQSNQVEDYRTGYPQFSALLASHESFQIFRRFSRVRVRLLLLKQDKISALEQRLDQIDTNESVPLFLGSSRDDSNNQRATTLAELDEALRDYGLIRSYHTAYRFITDDYPDHFVDRSSRILESDPAQPRDVRSVQNWVNGTGCISWEETEYLTYCNDLRCLVRSKDSAAMRFEAWVENALQRLFRKKQMRSFNNLSRDPHVFIPSTSIASTMARMLIVSLVAVMISLPIILCVFVDSSAARITIVISSLIIFLIILSALVTQKTHEMILAGATYTTVLVIFISETSSTAR